METPTAKGLEQGSGDKERIREMEESITGLETLFKDCPNTLLAIDLGADNIEVSVAHAAEGEEVLPEALAQLEEFLNDCNKEVKIPNGGDNGYLHLAGLFSSSSTDRGNSRIVPGDLFKLLERVLAVAEIGQ